MAQPSPPSNDPIAAASDTPLPPQTPTMPAAETDPFLEPPRASYLNPTASDSPQQLSLRDKNPLYTTLYIPDMHDDLADRWIRTRGNPAFPSAAPDGEVLVLLVDICTHPMAIYLRSCRICTSRRTGEGRKWRMPLRRLEGEGVTRFENQLNHVSWRFIALRLSVQMWMLQLLTTHTRSRSCPCGYRYCPQYP